MRRSTSKRERRRGERAAADGCTQGPPCRRVPVAVVHLIDGTFDLFRYFLSSAAAFDRSVPEELRAVCGVVKNALTCAGDGLGECILSATLRKLAGRL